MNDPYLDLINTQWDNIIMMYQAFQDKKPIIEYEIDTQKIYSYPAQEYLNSLGIRTRLEYYSPGDHFVIFEVNGAKCGLLICYDIRFPELYRAYVQQGVEVIFQSFYNARQKPGSIHPIIMPITAQARAATNYFFMSLSNSSAKHSWPCHFITPDGLIAQKLIQDEPGILISAIDVEKKYYDASKPFRMDAINGKLNSGETVEDIRSQDRKIY